MLIDFTNSITNWIFPRRCVVCNQDISHHSLCSCCASLVIKIPSPMLGNEKPALFFYEGVIKNLIIRAKFYGSLQHAEVLIELARATLTDLKILNSAPDFVTAVPTHWLNRLKRGLDLPELFGLMLADFYQVPFVSTLKRNSYFHRQSLAANKQERIAGIVNAFSPRAFMAFGMHVLVIDDVVTTGATFNESRKILQASGVKTTCLAIARTP